MMEQMRVRAAVDPGAVGTDRMLEAVPLGGVVTTAACWIGEAEVVWFARSVAGAPLWSSTPQLPFGLALKAEA